MGKSSLHSGTTVALALRVYLQENGNCVKAAAAAGVSKQAVAGWARRGNWAAILEQTRRDVEAEVAAEALRQQVTIRELQVNLHYKALAYMHSRVLKWETEPELTRGPWPFDPLKVADAMAKAGPGPRATDDDLVTEDALVHA
jgi:hypothetical protein